VNTLSRPAPAPIDSFLFGIGNVSEYNATTGAPINSDFITITSTPTAPTNLAVSGNNLLVGDGFNSVIHDNDATTGTVVEWRGSLRAPFPDPAHQTGRADLPHLGFRTRVLLSLRPRQVVPIVGQPDYSELLIKILVGKPILDPPLYLVLSFQPLAQPTSNVAIHAFIGFAHRTKPKIIGPSL